MNEKKTRNLDDSYYRAQSNGAETNFSYQNLLLKDQITLEFIKNIQCFRFEIIRFLFFISFGPFGDVYNLHNARGLGQGSEKGSQSRSQV